MTAYGLAFDFEGLLGFCEPDELDWDCSALMQKLEETMLAVSSRFAKVDNGRLVCDLLAFCINTFSVAFHIELLNMRGEFAKSLTVGNDGPCRVLLNHSPVKSEES